MMHVVSMEDWPASLQQTKNSDEWVAGGKFLPNINLEILSVILLTNLDLVALKSKNPNKKQKIVRKASDRKPPKATIAISGKYCNLLHY